MISKVNIQADEEAKKEKMVDEFLYGEGPDRQEQLHIARERATAMEKMEDAIKNREEKVDPKLVEILKKHYGVNFDVKGVGKVRLGGTTKKKSDCDGDVNRLYQYAAQYEQHKEDLAEALEEERRDKCPFAPSLTNKSRQIYASDKKKILEKREQRKKNLEEKREMKQKMDAQATRTPGSKNEPSKDPFSRRLPRKQRDKPLDDEAQENKDQNTTIKRDKTREQLEAYKRDAEESNQNEVYGSNKKKKVSSHQADTFHKGMMEWCDRKEKNRTQKTVEHWIDNFEHPDNLKNSIVNKNTKHLRSKASQTAHANSLIACVHKREESLEKQRGAQLNGLFKPKVTQHIPTAIVKGFGDRHKEVHQVKDHPVNLVYYSRNPDKDVHSTFGQTSKSKSPIKSGRHTLNLVEAQKDQRKQIAHSLAGASDF